MKHTAKLIVSCPDRRGLVARISDFIFRNGGNILHFDQHTNLQAGVFLARLEWELEGFQIPREKIADCFQGIALECGMQFELIFSDHVPRVAILASRLPHCLQDLLLRQQAGELKAEIALILSNHEEPGQIAQSFGIPFRYFPITADYKPEQAEAIPALKNYFKAYVISDQIRHIIETGQLTDLATNPVFSTRDFRAVPSKYRTLIPDYIKDPQSVGSQS